MSFLSAYAGYQFKFIKSMNRCNPNPLPQGEGWGEGCNHYLFNQLIRIPLRLRAPANIHGLIYMG